MAELQANFIEKIAEIIAITLTTEETALLYLPHSLQKKVQEIQQNPVASKQLCKHPKGSCRVNALRGFSHAFAASFIVKYIIQLIATRKSAVRDSLRFSLFFGCLIGSFKGSNCLMRYIRGVEDWKNSFVAGLVSGLSLVVDSRSRRQAISLYITCRSLQFIQEFYEVKVNPVWLMAICNTQIIYSWMSYPQTLQRSYYNWIYNLADLEFYYGPQGARTAASLLTSLSKSEPISQSVLQGVVKSQNPLVPCALIHPQTDSCTMGSLQYTQRCFPKAFKMYLPLNIVMMLIWRQKLLREDPVAFMKKLGISTIRSSTFITAFAALAWLPPCYIRKYVTGGKETTFAYLINGFLSGCTVLIEQPPSRRMELAMYCLPRAVESAWNLIKFKTQQSQSVVGQAVVHNLSRNGVDVGFFSLAMAIMMTIYSHHRAKVPSSYENIMIRFFGEN